MAFANADGRGTVTSTERIIVLGTGTGVGKTWVTAALARALRRSGASVVALKPIESGVVVSAESDAALLASASSAPPSDPPFVFAEPISPHLAARRSGRAIDLRVIVEHVKRHEAALQNRVTSHVTSFSLIETAGGCLTPLAPGIVNRDLALALEPATWLLVAPDALGVLHDVTATLGALAALGRQPDHVVLSEARARDASTGTNAAELRELGIASPAAVAARGDDGALDDFARALIARSNPG